MKLTLQQLTALGYVETSAGTFVRRRPVGALAPGQPQPQPAGALDEPTPPRRRRARGLGRGTPAESRGGLQFDLVAFLRLRLDDDNLTGGLKPLRDAVAQSLGIDEADPRLRFVVHQCPGAGPHGVVVRITELP